MSRSQETATVDRRTGPRAAVEFSLSVRSREQNDQIHANLHDLSATGIAIHTDSDLPAQSTFEVTLHVPYEMTLTQTVPVRFQAEVVRNIQQGQTRRRRIAATLLPLQPPANS